MSIRKVTRKGHTRGKAIREYRRKKQRRKAGSGGNRKIKIPSAKGAELSLPRHILRDIKGISWRTNRRSRQKSNFHRGENVGNVGSDITGIRRIVTGIEGLIVGGGCREIRYRGGRKGETTAGTGNSSTNGSTEKKSGYKGEGGSKSSEGGTDAEEDRRRLIRLTIPCGRFSPRRRGLALSKSEAQSLNPPSFSGNRSIRARERETDRQGENSRGEGLVDARGGTYTVRLVGQSFLLRRSFARTARWNTLRDRRLLISAAENAAARFTVSSFLFSQLQIFGFNSQLYNNFSDALHRAQGIVAVSLLLQVGDLSNPELRTFTQQLDKIKYGGQAIEIKRFGVRELLPDTKHYMTYDGSTTMPACHETTTWIILNKPIYITKQQASIALHALRQLMQGDEKQPNAPLANNFRPPQPLHHRPVRTNIDFNVQGPKNCPTMNRDIYYKGIKSKIDRGFRSIDQA
ncbi:Carbonic anhydrase-related protein [Ooceraea biroi]|uniref:Carbonic anhydrase-related protein n=1 Tax=Ooceraea biroi TaxID=2015173 RepID=A0A026WQ71_OOCBI|nr:Carbonic anhydrase-related protein [Ooceraea biroi]